MEVEHGRSVMRWKYNERCLARVRSEGRMVRGEHAGFCDLFVPVPTSNGKGTVLVAGPYALAYPTSAQMVERWYDLVQASATVSDPEFSRYLAAAQATLTLEGSLAGAFERLTSCLAHLLAGAVGAEELRPEVASLAERLSRARSAEQMWEAARSMVDDRTTHIWSMRLKRDPLRHLGMKQPPDHALVGFLSSRSDEPDAIDEALRCRAFQRAAVDLARRRGNVVCGQVGDRGIALLTSVRGTAARTRAALLELSVRAAQCARRFGLKLHMGIAESANQSANSVADVLLTTLELLFKRIAFSSM